MNSDIIFIGFAGEQPVSEQSLGSVDIYNIAEIRAVTLFTVDAVVIRCAIRQLSVFPYQTNLTVTSIVCGESLEIDS